MKTNLKILNGILGLVALLITLQGNTQAATTSTNVGYVQVNLVADTATNSVRKVDPNLVNPWGLVIGPGVVYVANNGTGKLSTYNALATGRTTAVTVPSPGDGGTNGKPTGLTANLSQQFVISNLTRRTRAPARLLAATEDGTIVAWHPSITPTNAVIVVDNSASNAVYKGVSFGRVTNNQPAIYAANFTGGTVDVFDGNFQPVTLATNAFTDPTLPAGFAPFNVRVFRGRVFVAYALQNPGSPDDLSGPGNGYINIYDTDGTFLRRFASAGPLNSPWGMAIAPGNFGKFSRALLVGNFGDGKINAYELLTGKFLGSLTRADGSDIVIQGLWGLTFETEEVLERESLFRAQRLYFTAGTGEEVHGLLGYIRVINPNIR